MGYTGMLVPEAFGGAGLGMVEAGVLLEQIGHHLSATPFLASGVLAVTAPAPGRLSERSSSNGCRACPAARPSARWRWTSTRNIVRRPPHCARRAMATAGGSTAPRPSCSTATWRRC